MTDQAAEIAPCVCHGPARPHAPHQPCDKGCQPDWHRDDCAVYLPLTSPASTHEFSEDVNDGSMCVCGIPALTHDQAYPSARTEADDAEYEALVNLLAEHRMNAVVEPPRTYLLVPHPGRTRVKCDGNTCDFYAEGPRYWDVVQEHDRHLADVLTRHYSPARTEADRG